MVKFIIYYDKLPELKVIRNGEFNIQSSIVWIGGSYCFSHTIEMNITAINPCLGVVFVPSHFSYSPAKSILVLDNTRNSCI